MAGYPVGESTRKKAAYLMVMGSSKQRGGCGDLTVLEVHTPSGCISM